MVPEICCTTDGQTDGQIDGQRKWYIEVGAPPKKQQFRAHTMSALHT